MKEHIHSEVPDRAGVWGVRRVTKARKWLERDTTVQLRNGQVVKPLRAVLAISST